MGLMIDWEQRNILEICKVFIGLVTTMTENYRKTGTLLIRNSDIKENKFKFIEQPIHLDESFAERNNSRRLSIGDVITVHTGDVGTSAVITEKEKGAIGFATINSRPNPEFIDSEYLATFLNTERHKNYAVKMSTGDGRSNYNLKDFNRLIVPVPTLEEQIKIGEFFKKIENTIALHQEKLNNLKLMKKAFLQVLFPQMGETEPRVRFANFDSKWEQRKLDTLMDFSNGINAPKENYGKGRKMISVMDILSSDELCYENIRNSVEVQSNVEERNKVENGDIVFVRSSEISEEVGWAKAYTDCNYALYSGFSIRGKKKSEYNPIFVEQSLNSNGRKQIEQKAGGSTRFNVSQSILSSINIMIPDFDEQEKIGTLFKQIDNTIVLHKKQVMILIQLKKAYLQKMFI